MIADYYLTPAVLLQAALIPIQFHARSARCHWINTGSGTGTDCMRANRNSPLLEQPLPANIGPAASLNLSSIQRCPSVSRCGSVAPND